MWYERITHAVVAVAAVLAAGCGDSAPAGPASPKRGSPEGRLAAVKLRPSDLALFDWFGLSVSVSGDRAAIGAPLDDDKGSNSGSVYLFVRSGAGWTEEAKLTASDGEADDSFGDGVSLDGDRLLVSAPAHEKGGDSRGSAYVFVRDGLGWTEEAKLVASGGDRFERFGTSVALKGNRALVGAPTVSTVRGGAYVFVRTAAGWTQEARLEPADRRLFFGMDVSLGEDVAVVGATLEESGTEAGAVYLFTQSGGRWTQAAKVTASHAVRGDGFSGSVSLDGDRLLVGAPWTDDGDALDTGAAYVFVRNGFGWTEEARLTARDRTAWDTFGASVSLRGDRALVGAVGDQPEGSFQSYGSFYYGSAYVFVREGGSWKEAAKLTADDVTEWDSFGKSVSLDGDVALVGAPFNNPWSAGAVYAFDLTRLGGRTAGR